MIPSGSPETWFPTQSDARRHTLCGNTEAAATALANAKTAIDAIKTAAELNATEEEAENLCPFCHKEHKGPLGKLIQFFHKILLFFKVIFNPNKACN